ncbi:hypothetical protein LX15_006196 [Streptoalloteichus tenebrarius]|uniref:Uncharacterized protein n=1 Tax=Streptoalloteichus tenebrarius (strain ATCC 17920 / DSM 40477 / JCM 4838 / CBS 697.72 / NBRC 16177 / NCIMB 11028 / NRRL B-12390 / A12253. 1 / ISP 5477) TaxID=1933 RepID=A0ABT1I3V5_STRSD|nr:hypothetical protein [Streptoalloteichus tenebrarius]MCP2262457.1 hypothetical protein [Streptoalloteichus tenebrarius]BFF01331.1 hypothetical protein GCM10020241_30060 [Streptoalloteichus tenebrarius]
MAGVTNWTTRFRGEYLRQAEALARREARVLPRWRTRARRRLLAVALVGWGLAMTVVGWDLYGAGDLDVVRTALFLAAMLAFAGAMILLRVLTHSVGERHAALLDERELALRGRYAYASFQIAMAVLGLVFMVAVANSATPDLGWRLTGALPPVIGLTGSLPTLLAAWNLPDDEPEDWGATADARAVADEERGGDVRA